jgi:Calcium-activated chloride channel
VRPDFEGKEVVSYIDGSTMKFEPSKTKERRKNVSFSAIFGLSLLVIGLVVSIYFIRGPLGNAFSGSPIYVINSNADSIAQSLASIVNALQIQISNFAYSFIATSLTDYENHRTDTEYEDSMVIKIFIFQFVNSYGSMFYVAFIEQFTTFDDACSTDQCFSSLAVNLGIIFGKDRRSFK